MPAKKKSAETAVEGPLERRLVQHLGAAAQLASDPLESDPTGYISTRCPTLDHIIGRPGIPCGKLTTIIGREGSGKSLLVYTLLAEAQRQGGLGVLIDTERRYMRDHGAALGIDHDRLLVIRGRTLEEVFATIEGTVDWVCKEEPGALVLIGYDSIAGSPTGKQLEDAVGATRPGAVARAVSTELPRLMPRIAGHRIALVLVNQLRQHVDIDMPWSDSRSEGRRKVMKNAAMVAEGALIFWSSLILYTSVSGILGEKDEPSGITVSAQVRKTSLGPTEGWKTHFDVDFLHGIDSVGSALDLLDRLGVVGHNAAWYTLGDQKFQRKGWPVIYAEHQDQIDEIIAAAPTAWLREK